MTIELGLWNELQGSEIEPQKPELTIEQKAAVLISRESQIRDLVSSLETLSQIEFPNPQTSGEIATLHNDLPRATTALETVIGVCEELAIRSAQTMRVWLDTVVKANSEWVEIDEKVQKAEKLLRRVEANKEA